VRNGLAFYAHDENICRAQALHSVIPCLKNANVSQHSGCPETFGFQDTSGVKTIKRTATSTYDKQCRAGLSWDRLILECTQTEHRGMLLTHGYCSSRAGTDARKFALLPPDVFQTPMCSTIVAASVDVSEVIVDHQIHTTSRGTHVFPDTDPYHFSRNARLPRHKFETLWFEYRYFAPFDSDVYLENWETLDTF
jgi:hypothetical protein